MADDDFQNWSQVEKRMAFYAGVCKHGKLTVSPAVARRWRAALPAAIEEEYARIDSGLLPRPLTPAVVLGDGDSGDGQAGAPERAPCSG